MSRPTNRDVTGVRIIGGDLRGRSIEYTGDERTRPMKDRVREAVFNLLGTDVAGKRVLDLFAGTGALGIEAISRGALHATFIERHLPTSQVIERNLERLEIDDLANVEFSDTFIWLKRYMLEDDVPWLVFCSPPYELYVTRQTDLLAALDKLVSLAPIKSLFVVECDDRFDVAQLSSGLSWDVRHYPPAVVAIGEKLAK